MQWVGDAHPASRRWSTSCYHAASLVIVRFRPTAKGPPSVTTTQHGFFDDDPIRHGCGRRRHGLVLPRHLDAWALQAPELQGDTWRPAHQIIKKWIDLDEGRRLERLNETTLRGDFLAEVFGEALGFTRPSSGRSDVESSPRVLPQWRDRRRRRRTVLAGRPNRPQGAHRGQGSNGQPRSRPRPGPHARPTTLGLLECDPPTARGES